ncbi:hypothetical protein [Kitasatospora sp. NPDC056531]|uniref:hypothetical protein n=1 Tax=Kitasatospora sp. NPDC056531 TaxID=3345856 RepID=UPI0036A8E521
MDERGLAGVAQILRSGPDRFDAHFGGRCLLSEDRQLLELAMTVTARMVIGMVLSVDPTAEYQPLDRPTDALIGQAGHAERHTDDVALLLVGSVPR